MASIWSEQAAVGADAGSGVQRPGTPHEVALARVRGGAAAPQSDAAPGQVRAAADGHIHSSRAHAPAEE
jgi:hypothetical protein